MTVSIVNRTALTTVDASIYPGANAGGKIAAAVTSLPAEGGIVDARSLTGAQTISNNLALTSKPITLLLGAGTYTITGTSGGNFVSIGTGSRIIGAGRGLTVLSVGTVSGTSNAVLNVSGANAEIAHLTIQDGGSSTNVQYVIEDSANSSYMYVHDVRISGITCSIANIHIANSPHAKIDNVWLDLLVGSGTAGHGILVQNTSGPASDYHQFSNITVNGGWFAFSLIWSNYNTLVNFTASATGQDSLEGMNINASSHNNFSNINVNGRGDGGYVSTTMEGITGLTTTINIGTSTFTTASAHNLVAGNAVVIATTGALPTGMTAGKLYYVISSGLTATDFELSATSNGSSLSLSGTQSGTQSVGLISAGNNIVGGTFTGNKFNGVAISEAFSKFTGLIVSGNATSGSTPDAIYIGTIATQNVLNDIYVYDIQPTPTQRYGVYLETGSTNNVVQNATFYGNTTGDYSDNGTGNQISYLDSSGNIRLPGNISAFGGQIAFPATQNPSSDVNTLDDYEEGTWTPVITFVTTGDLSVVYSTQVGNYTKIGRLVIVNFVIVTSTFTFTTASGDMRITGLPFTIGIAGYRGALSWGGITKAGYTQIVSRLIPANTYFNLVASGSGVALSNVATADTPTTSSIVLHGTAVYTV